MSRPQKRSFNRPQKQTGQRRGNSKANKKKLAPAKTLSGISAFQDAQGKVSVWPSERRLDAQTAVLEHLAAFFEGGRIYPEFEVKALMRAKVSLDDLPMLLGELIDREYLRHDEAAKTYWRATGRPTSLPPEPVIPEPAAPEPVKPAPVRPLTDPSDG
ncbi:DUF2087 domain-containing protein [Deinococcus radiomollis]|uniref:DUF2087 domain-containing protein n=1 Tax=Deinococcus radiomollis TaxID=468916 RepID=UPI0038928392